MDIPADQYALYAEFGIAAEEAQVLDVFRTGRSTGAPHSATGRIPGGRTA